ncbi:MAG: DUF4143 domain-containing protein [Acidobacteria bacterium]|nr:DUF4143 domain-containing protein [Acidobacteriota bacterium]MYH29849.1 DUF4143 domain-containing protein [Acidobacteriota bacterium]MYK88364.1 DUF4143 domain-containing protein [Acidobacteriota bacterium]
MQCRAEPLPASGQHGMGYLHEGRQYVVVQVAGSGLPGRWRRCGCRRPDHGWICRGSWGNCGCLRPVGLHIAHGAGVIRPSRGRCPAIANVPLDLLASFQLVRLPPYSVNRSKRLVKSPKLYWSDPALALWMSGADTVSGEHLENLVLADLLVWRDGQAPAPDVLFWRTTTDREVDFVIETGDRLLAVEVKAAPIPGLADTRGLRLFREEYRDRFAGGLLLHGGSGTQWMAEGVLAVPWWRVV